MQIRSIDNTNFQALKISPKLRAELAKSTDRYLKSLDNYGETMADVKLYNVVFDENMRTHKIFHTIKNSPAGDDGDTVGGFYPDTPMVFRKLFGENAKEKYGKFKRQDALTQAAEYSRMLEEAEIKEINKRAKEEAQQSFAETLKKENQRIVNKLADELIEKFGYEPPKDIIENKKSWWQKLFN